MRTSTKTKSKILLSSLLKCYEFDVIANEIAAAEEEEGSADDDGDEDDYEEEIGKKLVIFHMI